LVPAESDVVPKDVEVRTQLTAGIRLAIPIVSSAMDTVTEAATAICMARDGGIGIVHKYFTIPEQALEITKVKKAESGVVVNPVTVGPDQKLAVALGLMKRHDISGLPVVAADGRPVGILDVEEVFDAPPDVEAACVYGTADPAHPGVAALERAGTKALAGQVTAFLPDDLGRYDLTPHQVREARAARGWRTMVGFQTRNPVHRAHEYLQKVALENVDGLLLHPLIGETKSDDIPAETRMRCYEVLLRDYYPAERTLLATNPAWMRYAGPREAIFHAVVRRNYGCTHFIVGRDHAGVGSYYDTYAAHRVFEELTASELGIAVLRFEHAFWCRKCQNMASTRTCPHPAEDHATLSGTRVRQLLAAGEPLPPEFTRPEVAEVLSDAEGARSPA